MRYVIKSNTFHLTHTQSDNDIKYIDKEILDKMSNIEINTLVLDYDAYIDHSYNLSYIPNNIETIYISDDYWQNVDYLPLNLMTLYFSHEIDSFNKSIDKLPSNLNVLHLGYWFNYTFDNLPPLLLCILFREYCLFKNRILDLPHNLKELYLPRNYNMNNINPFLISNICKNLEIKN